ncbi:TadE/TadG family type IV pilus assembly protein [Thalassobacillus sp. C254]|uniref:TadE/TadG family type IV pilus assembly protein n=1 Tax=Thalassobacillus sp. C254 TaxID=1225341 RepID=UPI0006D0DE50|nr:TadE family protein [Thalassobacillus sp. C254]
MVKREDGQSLVEFALVLPILLLLVVGIFDFGRVMYTYLQMELVTQESVRMGGLGQSDAEIEDFARNQFSGDSSKLMVSISPGGTREAGTYVTVEMSYPEELLKPLGGASISHTLTTSSTIRVE